MREYDTDDARYDDWLARKEDAKYDDWIAAHGEPHTCDECGSVMYLAEEWRGGLYARAEELWICKKCGNEIDAWTD